MRHTRAAAWLPLRVDLPPTLLLLQQQQPQHQQQQQQQEEEEALRSIMAQHRAMRAKTPVPELALCPVLGRQASEGRQRDQPLIPRLLLLLLLSHRL